MMDIAAAEEEIARWKVAAQQEADAGKAVEQDFVAQVYNNFVFHYFFKDSVSSGFWDLSRVLFQTEFNLRNFI